jgi:hypothetical protein
MRYNEIDKKISDTQLYLRISIYVYLGIFLIIFLNNKKLK